MFKKGTRVKLMFDDVTPLKAGSIGTISDVDSDGWYIVSFNRVTQHIPEEDLKQVSKRIKEKVIEKSSSEIAKDKIDIMLWLLGKIFE